MRLETRHTHVDRHRAIRLDFRIDDTGQGFYRELVLVGQPLVTHKTRETARAVAALLDLTAIGVENAVTEIELGARRALDDQHLVAADTEAPVGEVSHLLGGQRHGLADGVNHDEIIAEAVHFGETQHVARLALASEQRNLRYGRHACTKIVIIVATPRSPEPALAEVRSPPLSPSQDPPESLAAQNRRHPARGRRAVRVFTGARLLDDTGRAGAAGRGLAMGTAPVATADQLVGAADARIKSQGTERGTTPKSNT